MSLLRYGLLSDTHGRIHSEVYELFTGVEAVFHAGDVVGGGVLAELQALAPVYAVAGNCDPMTPDLPPVRLVNPAFGRLILVHGHHHDVKNGSPEELVERFRHYDPRVIVFGHTHGAVAERHDGILAVNPGAAGKPSPGEKSSVAVLIWDTDDDSLQVDFHALDWTRAVRPPG